MSGNEEKVMSGQFTIDPGHRRLLVFVILGACALAAAGHGAREWSRAARQGWSGMTLEAVLNNREMFFKVTRVLPRSPADLADLRVGDKIVAVDGVPARELRHLVGMRQEGRAGDVVRYRCRRDEREFETPVRLGNPLERADILGLVALNVLAALICLGIGGFVYARRPEDGRAQLFFVMCVLFGLLRLVSAGPTEVYYSVLQENFGNILLQTALIFFLSPTLLHFCLIFPRRRPLLAAHPHLLRWIYGLPVVNVLLLGGFFGVIASLLSQSSSGDVNLNDAGRWLQQLVQDQAWLPPAALAALLGPAIWLIHRRWLLRKEGLKKIVLAHPGQTVAALLILPLTMVAAMGSAYWWLRLGESFGVVTLVILGMSAGMILFLFETVQLLFFPVAACAALFRSYREARVEERQQIRWPLWGTLAAVAGFFLWEPLVEILIALLGPDRHSGTYVALVFLFQLKMFLPLLIPVTVAVAILKFHLMEITVYIRRTVVYALLTGLLGLLFLLLAGGLGGLLTRLLNVRNEWAVVAATLTVVAAGVPLRNRVQTFVDRRFFRRRRDYAQSLRQFTREVAEAGSRRRLANVAVDRLQEAVQSRTALIFLRAPGERAFSVAAQIGLPDELLPELRLTPESSLLRLAADHTGPPPPGLPEAEARVLAAAGCFRLASIRRREEFLGVLCLGGKLSDEAYDEEDDGFLLSAADQIAAGLENLRLEDQQHEFEKAREIQESLLPKTIPRAPGFDIAGAWQPARAVGGDYYDVLEPGPDRLALVIADVSGKGLPAALLMSNLQAAVKAFAAETPSPAELCGRVNRMICGNITPGRFITFVYAVLDTRTRALSYANAGHNPPLVRRADGTRRSMNRGGPVLGVFAEARYEEETIELVRGDRLILFTDGVSEAADERDEQFGEDRLAALLEGRYLDAGALRTAVMQAVTAFCGNNFQDDATLIAVMIE